MDTLDLLEALNPEPANRGNPGPCDAPSPSSEGRSRRLAMIVTVAAAVVALGAFFIDRLERPIEVDVADDVVEQPASQEPEVVESDPPETEVRPVVVADGDPIARLVIPTIDLDAIVVRGTGVASLQRGPGHYVDTALPGQRGNAAIAGLRTTYGALFFRLDELGENDSIFVTTLQGTFHYEVVRNSIVEPNETQVLAQTDQNLLTLTTTHPPYASTERLIVVAELVGEPAPSTSLEDLVGAMNELRPVVSFESTDDVRLPTVAVNPVPYSPFTGNDDAIATAWAFVVSQFTELTDVELGAVAERDGHTFVRWRDPLAGSEGWITLMFGDGRYWVHTMATDGFEFDLGIASTGAKGTYRGPLPARIEIRPPRDFDLGSSAFRPNTLDFARTLAVIKLDDASPGGVHVIDVPFANDETPQAVRLTVRDVAGRPIAVFASGLEQSLETPVFVAVDADAVAELEAVLKSHPLIVFDSFTLDPWQSADSLDSVFPDLATEQIDEVPTTQLVSMSFHAPRTRADRQAIEALLDSIAEFATVIVRPNAGSDGVPATRLPAESYVVDRLPSVARCGAAGVVESPAEVSMPGAQTPQPTAAQAASQVAWKLDGSVIEFVDDQGDTLGFATAAADRPRTFLAVVAVRQLSAGWIVDEWQQVGC